MPQLIRSADEIMREAGRDMAFVQFGSPFERTPGMVAARGRHLTWFRARGIRTETAAPRGWLEGDPFVTAVHFDGTDDPRIAAYSAEFEDVEGKSLDAKNYQMVIWPHAAWRRNYEAYLDQLGDNPDDGT